MNELNNNNSDVKPLASFIQSSFQIKKTQMTPLRRLFPL